MKVRYLSVTEGEKRGIFAYPNFHKSGSICGMKRFYGRDALLVGCGNYIYDVSAAPDIYHKARACK